MRRKRLPPRMCFVFFLPPSSYGRTVHRRAHLHFPQKGEGGEKHTKKEEYQRGNCLGDVCKEGKEAAIAALDLTNTFRFHQVFNKKYFHFFENMFPYDYGRIRCFQSHFGRQTPLSTILLLLFLVSWPSLLLLHCLSKAEQKRGVGGGGGGGGGGGNGLDGPQDGHGRVRIQNRISTKRGFPTQNAHAFKCKNKLKKYKPRPF